MPKKGIKPKDIPATKGTKATESYFGKLTGAPKKRMPVKGPAKGRMRSKS